MLGDAALGASQPESAKGDGFVVDEARSGGRESAVRAIAVTGGRTPKSRQRWMWVSMVVLLGVVVVAVWLWARSSVRPLTSATAPTIVAEPSPPAHPPVAMLAVSAPLPAPGTPLRLLFDQLRQRADQGDARAACRLAAELQQCEQVRQELAQLDDILGKLRSMFERTDDPNARAGGQRRIDDLTATRGQDLLRKSEQCVGAPAVTAAERAALWRSAAVCRR